MNRYVRSSAFLLCFGVVMALGVGQAFGTVGDMTRVSLTNAGAQATGNSSDGSVSLGGRFVAFSSEAALVVDDTNGDSDIYLRDRLLGTTTRVSVTSAGGQAAGFGEVPSISDDGRFVAFATTAGLVPEDTDAKNDIYLRDTILGTTTWVSHPKVTNVDGDQFSIHPAISGDGAFVAYESESSDLVVGDTNGTRDVFEWERATGINTRVSVNSAGGQVSGPASGEPVGINRDGRYVAFGSEQPNLTGDDGNPNADIFVHDRSTGATVKITKSDEVGMPLDRNCIQPCLSADGSKIAFISYASNLIAAKDDYKPDVFLYDRANPGVYVWVNVAVVGGSSDHEVAGGLQISDDGRYVTFCTYASDIVAGDTNDEMDVFVRDTQLNTSIRASVSSTGAQAMTGKSITPAISPDASFVVFPSEAPDLIDGDTNGSWDVFAKQIGALPPSATATSLSISASSLTPPAGTAVTLSGVLRTPDSAGAPLAGQTVALQKQVAGAWVETGMSGSTSVSGVSFGVTPSASTTYRLHYAGASGSYLSCDSAAVTVVPQAVRAPTKTKPVLGAPVAPKTMKKNKSYTIYGTLKPQHARGSKCVWVYREKRVKVKVKGKSKWTWKKYSRVQATADTKQRYKVKLKLTSKGTWRLRAYAPADGLHLKAWSAKYDTVKVK